jgi:hypothetical protein
MRIPLYHFNVILISLDRPFNFPSPLSSFFILLSFELLLRNIVLSIYISCKTYSTSCVVDFSECYKKIEIKNGKVQEALVDQIFICLQ